MQIEVKIVGEPDNVPASERKSITVETHARRGDMFNVLKNDGVMQGEATTFNVPSGGRLVITTPETHEALVYDRDQGATIRPSNQASPNASVADKPVTQGGTYTPPSVPPQAPNTAQPPIPPDTTPPPPQRGAPASAPTTQQPPPSTAERQKAAQQSAPRPPGEKAPLPGSPVGSPPAGNEGKDNK